MFAVYFLIFLIGSIDVTVGGINPDDGTGYGDRVATVGGLVPDLYRLAFPNGLLRTGLGIGEHYR